MSVAICDRCNKLFVMGREEAPLAKCRICNQPLRLIAHEEALARLHELQAHQTPDPIKALGEWGNDLRRNFDDLRDELECDSLQRTEERRVRALQAVQAAIRRLHRLAYFLAAVLEERDELHEEIRFLRACLGREQPLL